MAGRLISIRADLACILDGVFAPTHPLRSFGQFGLAIDEAATTGIACGPGASLNISGGSRASTADICACRTAALARIAVAEALAHVAAHSDVLLWQICGL